MIGVFAGNGELIEHTMFGEGEGSLPWVRLAIEGEEEWPDRVMWVWVGEYPHEEVIGKLYQGDLCIDGVMKMSCGQHMSKRTRRMKNKMMDGGMIKLGYQFFKSVVEDDTIGESEEILFEYEYEVKMGVAMA